MEKNRTTPAIVTSCVCQMIWLNDEFILVLPAAVVKSQKDWETFGCRQQDDMQEIFDTVLNCDLLVLAAPIYSWYCTPPAKAVLDWLVYSMNKYYEEGKGPALGLESRARCFPFAAICQRRVRIYGWLG